MLLYFDFQTEILATRTDMELVKVKASYTTQFDGNRVETDIKGETSGDLEQTYLKLLQGGRTSGADLDKDVQKLYDAGEGKWGTDEDKFIDELAGNSRSYNERLYEGYEKKYEKVLSFYASLRVFPTSSPLPPRTLALHTDVGRSDWQRNGRTVQPLFDRAGDASRCVFQQAAV